MTRRAWIAFLAMAVLWGVPYLFLRIAVQELNPVFVAWSRMAIAAVVLLPIAIGRGSVGEALKRWPWIVLTSSYYMALAWTLIPYAEQSLPSSLTAIVIAGVPIVVTLIEIRRERPTWRRVAGLLIGFAGVAVLVGLDIGLRPAQLIAVGALMVVLVCYAAAPVMIRRKLGGIDPIATASTSLASASLMLLVPALVLAPHRLPSTGVLVSLAILGLFCSAVALVLWYYLIGAIGPARSTIVTYLNPAVAVIAGVLVLHERIGAGALGGLLLILAGSYLATTGKAKASAAAAAPAAPAVRA